MILKNDVDVLDKIQELFSDCLRTRQFGEFSVSVTMYNGRPVKLRNLKEKILFVMNMKKY